MTNYSKNINYLFIDEAKTKKIYLADDTGIVYYIRDIINEHGEREFLLIHYHSYTKNLNKELVEVFKNFTELGECYGVAEHDNYYFVSKHSLAENKILINATFYIIRRLNS